MSQNAYSCLFVRVADCGRMVPLADKRAFLVPDLPQRILGIMLGLNDRVGRLVLRPPETSPPLGRAPALVQG
jgi:hypothetical protein